MRDVSEGVKSPAGLPATHAHHDRALVSRYAVDDAYPAERELAQQLVERCVECAALAVDIRALSTTLATSEAPRRPRDFRISAEQAERLRGSSFERFMRRLAAPALAPARPLAGVALSIGLAMAVAGAALPTPTPATMSAGLEQAPPGAEQPEIDFEPRGAPAAGGEPFRAESTDAPVFSSDNSSEEGFGQRQMTEDAAADDTRIVLMIAGLTVALLALGTLLMILFARRRMSDPLLR